MMDARTALGATILMLAIAPAAASSQAVATDLESRIRTVETGLRPGDDRADTSGIRWTLEERMAHYGAWRA